MDNLSLIDNFTKMIMNHCIFITNNHYKMKKFIVFLPVIVLGLILSSCAVVSSVPLMEKNYNSRMNSAEELAAKSHIKVFMSEKDVPCDYTVIGLIKYKPYTIPIILTEKGENNRRLLKKSVLKAAEIGGDAIIVQGMGLCKVITAPGLSNNAGQVKTDNKKTSWNLEPFENGTISSFAPNERKKLANALQDEIEDELDDCDTREALAEVTRKVDALEKYYKSEGLKTKKTDDFRDELKEIEEKIIKKENRANKIAESKAKIKEKINSVKEQKKNK